MNIFIGGLTGVIFGYFLAEIGGATEKESFYLRNQLIWQNDLFNKTSKIKKMIGFLGQIIMVLSFAIIAYGFYKFFYK